MNILDVIFTVFLLIGAYRGYKKGLILELVAILSLVVGVAASFALLQWGITTLNQFVKLPSNILPIVAFALIFLGVIVGLNSLGKALKRTIDLTLIGSLDGFAGAIVGGLKAAFFLSVVLWIFSSIGLSFFGEVFSESQLLAYIQPVAPKAIEYLSIVMPFLEDLYKSVQVLLQP